MASNPNLGQLVARYTSDPESVYNTWFMQSTARLKAFRSIRRGVTEVVRSVRDGTFGNDFKGSPLETVLDSITEQKQVFDGAAHPFYWKPKLRIPDIYENKNNKKRPDGRDHNCRHYSIAQTLDDDLDWHDRFQYRDYEDADYEQGYRSLSTIPRITKPGPKQTSRTIVSQSIIHYCRLPYQNPGFPRQMPAMASNHAVLQIEAWALDFR